jgi:ankyrin repeat protein
VVVVKRLVALNQPAPPLERSRQMKHLLITTIAAVVLVGCGNPEADRALLKAAQDGNIVAVKKHLAAGADVNAKGWFKLTLHIVEGGNLNKKTYTDWTPLHWAAYRDHKEIVELLIAEGADVNAKDAGTTPLDVAEEFNLSELASILRKHGAKKGN